MNSDLEVKYTKTLYSPLTCQRFGQIALGGYRIAI